MIEGEDQQQKPRTKTTNLDRAPNVSVLRTTTGPDGVSQFGFKVDDKTGQLNFFGFDPFVYPSAHWTELEEVAPGLARWAQRTIAMQTRCERMKRELRQIAEGAANCVALLDGKG